MFTTLRLPHLPAPACMAKITGRKSRSHVSLIWIPVKKHAIYPHLYAIRTYGDLSSQKLSVDGEAEKGSRSSKQVEKWTRQETIQLKDRLAKSFQIWQIAAQLGKTPWSVLQKIRSNKDLRTLWRPRAKGKFGNAETAFLIRLRRFGVRREVIALYLGRDENSVRAKINREALRIFRNETPAPFQGPQALTPELEDSITRGRLQDAFDDLLRCNMADYWRDLLHQEQAKAWLSVIAENIPTHVKKLLASHAPPSIQQLKKLPWVETDVPGVYGWLMRPIDRWYFSRECYLYVGSAGKPLFGLNGRKAQHLSTTENNPRLLTLIRRNKLKRHGKFVTFLSMDSDNAQQYNALVTKHIVILAEAIFTALFGALQQVDYEPHLQGLRPWGGNVIPWTGCCSHNPLTMDFLPPGALPEPETVQELRMRSRDRRYWELDEKQLHSVMGNAVARIDPSTAEG